MTNPNIPELSRELARLAGIDTTPTTIPMWETCDEYGHIQYSVVDPGDGTPSFGKIINKELPDFSDAREVIRVMRKRKEFWAFIDYATGGNIWLPTEKLIRLFTDTTGLLLQEAVRFLRKEKMRSHERS